MSSSNANSPSESIVGGKNKSNDNNNNDGRRSNKKSKGDMEVDINDKKQEDAYEDSFCGSFINAEDPVIDQGLMIQIVLIIMTLRLN